MKIRKFLLVLKLINSSLEKFNFAHALKQAIVKPQIKIVNLSHEEFADYRPISNLSYISKLLERSAFLQITDHPESNALFCAFKRVYRVIYSTDSVQLKVTNDMLLNLELKRNSFYIGLDLSVAFDTLDHELLLLILEVSLKFRVSVLCFTKSYLSGQSQKVLIKDVLTSEQDIKTGVPQGSVLGP